MVASAHVTAVSWAVESAAGLQQERSVLTVATGRLIAHAVAPMLVAASVLVLALLVVAMLESMMRAGLELLVERALVVELALLVEVTQLALLVLPTQAAEIVGSMQQAQFVEVMLGVAATLFFRAERGWRGFGSSLFGCEISCVQRHTCVVLGAQRQPF